MNINLSRSCVIALGILITPLFADTIPGGDVSGTWYKSHSPYYITGDITVNANTLTIEPGVDVMFLGNYRLSVYNGRLMAVGTAADSIRFLPQDTAVGWQGIYIPRWVDTCRFSYCAIRHAKHSGIRTLLGMMQATLLLDHCLIAHCRSDSGGGIHWADNNLQTMRISNSEIAYNTAEMDSGGKGGGIYCEGYELFIDSCWIHDNRAVTRNNSFADTTGGGGIFANTWTDTVAITNSVITNNFVGKSDGGTTWCAAGGGMWLENMYPIISKCLIRNNRLRGLAIRHGAGILLGGWFNIYTLKANISYCDISRNYASNGGAGVYVFSVDSTTITNCTFFGQDTGYALVFSGSGGDRLRLANCIIANNEHGLSVPASQCDISYNDVFDSPCTGMPPGFGVLDTTNHNADSCDCYYNIFLDPMFVDTATTDLHLLAASPCIDAGDPTAPYDPDGTIADQGCYWFNQIGVEETPVKKSMTLPIAGSTIFSGPLVLPKGKVCRVFDITGRQIQSINPAPGIYFIEIDGKAAQKVIKVR